MDIPQEKATPAPRLFDGERVHRDAFLSEAIWALERERLFPRAWIFLGHLSQVPAAGDFITATIAGTPLLMVRQADGGVAVLINRCAHKGAKIACDPAGSAGRSLRCPYHAWAYRLDGSLLALPLREGYEGTGLHQCESGEGLASVTRAVYRGFVFVRLDPVGADFATQVPEAMRRCLDSMIDRSPRGELAVAGPPLRSVIHCNWKIYLENINDTVHAGATHESSAQAAETVWQRAIDEGSAPAVKPVAIEQLLPFAQGDQLMERMGGRVFAGGHSILGIHASLHSDYSAVPGYEAAMIEAWGEARAREILAWSPQNAVIWPSIAFKGNPQTMRVIRPLAVDRTLVEIWAFRALGAPDLLLERTLSYNRIVFSAMSLVAHDDVQVFESIQQALGAPGNPWVSLHRGKRTAEPGPGPEGVVVGGTDERLMRNQYAAWSEALWPVEGAAR
jgi:phenylpropionate dioxygenase-like ring-hydroxylating dioxygenase large terminal subunit